MSLPVPMGIQTTLSDDRVIDCRINLYSRVAADSHFRTNPRLGSREENPNLYAAFQAWVILKREGVISIAFDQFLEGTNSDELHAVDVQVFRIETPGADDLGESSSPATTGD